MNNLGLFVGRKRASTIPPNPSARLVRVVPIIEGSYDEKNAAIGQNKDAVEVTWLSELSNGDRHRWENMCRSSASNTIPVETIKNSSSPDDQKAEVELRRRAVSFVDNYLLKRFDPAFLSRLDNNMSSQPKPTGTTHGNTVDLYKDVDDLQDLQHDIVSPTNSSTIDATSGLSTPKRNSKSIRPQALLSPRQSLYSAPTTSVSRSENPFDLSPSSTEKVEDATEKIVPEEDPIFHFDQADKCDNIDQVLSTAEEKESAELEPLESEIIVAPLDYFSPSSPENNTSSPIDIQPNLKASEVSPPFLQRRFTAPEKSYMSLQERRLSLRNRHLNAVPLSKSNSRSKMAPSVEAVKPGAGDALSATITYPPKHKKSFGDLSKVNEVSVPGAENVNPKLSSPLHSLPNHLSNRRYSSLQDSLRHRRTPSMENSSYIEHLEGQVADLTTRLQSYTSPSSEKSHAAVVQRLNNKVRSLENQIAEWETVFEDRVRENERRHADTERIYVNKLKSLREQILTLDQNNVTLEEELENERKENVTLRLEVTENKALALENAKLAEALKSTFGTIEKLEAEVAMLNSPTQVIAAKNDGLISVASNNEVKDKSNKEQIVGSPLQDITEENTVISPHSSISDFASLGDVRHDFGHEHSKTANHRPKRMRRFPSGISQPKQLILTTPVETSPPPSSRRSSVDPFTTDLRRNSNRWSISKDEPITASESLFAELAKQDEDFSPTTDEDEDDKEPVVTKSVHDEHAHCPSSPTDTETTSDSSGSTFSDVSPSSPTSPGLSNLFFAPFRVTSSVITHVGYGIFHPQKAVRSAREKAISTFIENRYVDIPLDSETYSQVKESSLKQGNMVSSVSYQDICQPTHLLMIQVNDKKVDTQDRHQTVRQSILKEFILKSSDESSSDESSRERHLANTFSKLCAEDSDVETTPRPRRTIMSESPPSDAEATIRAQSTRREGLRLDTKMLPKRPIPIRPTRSSVPNDVFDSSSRRVSLPPPYSEYADRVQTRLRKRLQPQPRRATRDSLDLAWSSGSEPDTEASLYIPESELARVLRQDISNGSLMHAMGLHLNSPFVLWTKLVLSFMITMFVAIRDGPEAALNHIDLGRKED